MRGSKLRLRHRSGSLFWLAYYTSTPSLSLLLFFSGIFFLKRRETNHSVWVMSRIVCREFSHTTNHCKMFYIVITLGWHSQTPLTESLFHVILISTGTCANLTSSNWSDLSQKCCPLWPNSPEVMPGKTGSHCQPCLSNARPQLSVLAHVQGASLFFSPFLQT